ncbi:hypothetical protein P8452_38026 [Trifolium repens]|nr:hypothetical protein P8452_38026 [Trifolium repens]
MTDPRNSYRPLANAYHPSALQVPYQGQYYVAATAPMQYHQPAPQRPQYQPTRPNHWSQISVRVLLIKIKYSPLKMFQMMKRYLVWSTIALRMQDSTIGLPLKSQRYFLFQNS